MRRRLTNEGASRLCFRLLYVGLVCVTDFTATLASENTLESAISVETIALTGQRVPGVSGRTFEHFFRKAVLNNRGETAFLARLECCGPLDGAFTTAGGSLSTLAVLDTPAFRDSGSTFFEINHVQIDDSGRTFVRGDVEGISSEFDTIAFGSRLGELVPVAESGTVVDPSEPDVLYWGFDFSHLGSGGRLAGRASTIRNDEVAPCCDVLFVSDGGPIAPLLRAGDQPEFTSADTVYGAAWEPAFERPVVNASGMMTTRVSTVDVNNPEVFSFHIVRIDHTGAVERIVSESFNPEPNPVDSLFHLSFPVINDHGDVAFGAVSTDLGDSLWLSRFGEMPSLVVKKGDEPPTLPGGRFVDFGLNPFSEMSLGISGDGHIAFQAEVSGEELGLGTGESLWIGTPDELTPIVVEGRPAPDVGGVFASSRSIGGDLIASMSVNERNQVAFVAQYQHTPSERRSALFATDSAGVLNKVAAPGDLLQVGPGDLRELEFIEFRSDIGNGALGSGLNDFGQIVFTARFIDGTSGVFLSNVVAVPEPSALALTPLGLLVILTLAARN